MLTPPRPHRQASAVRWKHSLSEGRAERADDVLAMDLRRPNLEALSAIAALLVLIGSDFYARRFWLDHPVTTAILASLTVVLVSVTVIDVVLTRRSERRWAARPVRAPGVGRGRSGCMGRTCERC